MTIPALGVRGTLGNPPPPPTPLVAAYAADEVVDLMGVSCIESNLVNADAVTAFNYLFFRHARAGRVDPNGSNRSLMNALAGCTIPVDWGGSVDDRGTFTPADRIDEMTNHPGGGISHMAGPNEPNAAASDGAHWPATISTNGPTSTDTYLGRNEVIRQQTLIKNTRITKGVTGIPYLMSPMAAKNKLDWWTALLAAGTVDADILNVHLYQGDEDVLKGGDLIANFNACNPAIPGATQLWLTEFGYHDLMSTVETHKPMSQTAQAIYFARGILQLHALTKTTKLRKAFIYELLDAPAGPPPDFEGHFGLFKMVGGTITAKPSAIAIHNMLALYNDPGTTYSPTGLDVAVNNINSVANLVTSLHQKRNGHWLFAIYRNESIFSAGVDTPITDKNVQIILPSSRTSTLTRPELSTTTGMGSGTITIPVGAAPSILEIV